MKKMRKLISLCIAMSLGLMIIPSVSAKEVVDESTPISTAEQLMAIKGSGEYYLTDTIYLSKVDWKPIESFGGTLNGRGFQIIGLSSDSYGLFKELQSGAEIKNLSMRNVDIHSTKNNVGAIASIIKEDADVLISNCHVSGVVGNAFYYHGITPKNDKSYVGALVGVSLSEKSKIVDCYSNAEVMGESRVGGLVGYNKGEISRSQFSGTILHSFDSTDYGTRPGQPMKILIYKSLSISGGIAAVNAGTIDNCLVEYATFRNNGGYIGGIAGKLNPGGKIESSITKSVVSSHSENAGAIAGYVGKGASVLNSYFYLLDESIERSVGVSLSKLIIAHSLEYAQDVSKLTLDFDNVWTLQNDGTRVALQGVSNFEITENIYD